MFYTCAQALVARFLRQGWNDELELGINLQTVRSLKDKEERSLNTPLAYTHLLYRLTTPLC